MCNKHTHNKHFHLYDNISVTLILNTRCLWCTKIEGQDGVRRAVKSISAVTESTTSGQAVFHHFIAPRVASVFHISTTLLIIAIAYWKHNSHSSLVIRRLSSSFRIHITCFKDGTSRFQHGIMLSRCYQSFWEVRLPSIVHIEFENEQPFSYMTFLYLRLFLLRLWRENKKLMSIK